jgi:hypothetical protein
MPIVYGTVTKVSVGIEASHIGKNLFISLGGFRISYILWSASELLSSFVAKRVDSYEKLDIQFDTPSWL